MMPAIKSLASELATRRNAIDFFAIAGMYLPNPDPTLRKQGADIQVYNDLLVDPFLSGCIVSRKSGVMSLEWQLDGQGGDVDLLRGALDALDMRQIMSDMLEAVLFGYAVLEVVWEKRGGLIVPSKVVAKPQHWFVFDMENRLLLRTRDHFMGEPVPDKKFLLVTNNETYMNPYGQGVLSRCFWPVVFKRGGLRFWIQFTEKYGSPFIIGKHPRGAGEKETEALADSLDRMIQDAVAVIPDDASVEIMEASGKAASADVYQKLLEFCKTEISIAVLGQNLTTEVRGGSYAAAQTHMLVRDEIIGADKLMIEEGINTLIKWIWEFNWPGEPPTWYLADAAQDLKSLADRDNVLTQAGVQFTKNYWLRAYGFDDKDIASTPVVGATGRSPLQEAPSFAESTQFTQDQQAIEELVTACLDRAGAVDEARVQAIMDAIGKARDFDELSGMLPSLVNTTPAMVDTLQKALTAAHLFGREQVNKEVR
jgi:phage gp29-like protein